MEQSRGRNVREEREEASNGIYTWRFQREAEVWRERMDGWTDGWREREGPLTDPLTTRPGGSAAFLTQQRLWGRFFPK